MIAPPSRPSRIAERLYRAALHAYPRAFRRAYGAALAQAFRDRSRDAYRRGGLGALLHVCGSELGDLATTAAKEHGDEIRGSFDRRTSMDVLDPRPSPVPPRLWGVRAATVVAVVVCLLASLNLYLLEDASALTPPAYGASPLLRVSYDGAYLSALAASVAVCAVVAYTVARAGAPVLRGLAAVAILVALGGFGGLLARHPATFLALALAFAGLVPVVALVGRAVAARVRPRVGRRDAAIVGACAGTGVALLANLLAVALHTLALNPVSHPLYMRGQIAGTHLNSLLVGLGVEVVASAACAASIGRALRASRPGRGGRLAPSA